MSSSTKILMFVVGALLFTFLALFLTVPEAQAQGFDVPPTPPQAEVLLPISYEKLPDSGNTTDRYLVHYDSDYCDDNDISGLVNWMRFYYDESIEDWIRLGGSGVGGCNDNVGTFEYSPQGIAVPEGYYARFIFPSGQTPPVGQPITESIWDNTLFVQLSYWNGEEPEIPLEPPSLPDLSYRDSLSWVNIDIPEFNQMYLTEEIDLGVSYRLRGQNPYNMSQALCDSSMDYTLTVFARPANNAGATLVPIYTHGFNPSPVGEGASAVCTGTITAQNLDLSSFNFGYSSLMLNAVLSIGTPTPPLSSNLDFLVSSEDPIFINLNGINDYLDETGAETPLDTPPSSYEDCTTWDFSCQITNAFLFLFRPTISIQQRAMNLWNDLYPRTPIPYIEFVISDLVPVVRSLSSAESADDGSVNISFPTQEMFDWDEDIDVFSFSRETFTGEDSYFPPTVYNTFRLLIGLGIHLGGIMYLVTATRRFFAGLYS